MRSRRNKSAVEPPTLAEENRLISRGYRLIAGIDEAGRGALAGPVVAAAIVLPQCSEFPRLEFVRDSKEISPAERDWLFGLIQEEAVAIGTGIVPPQVIDSIGIVEATRRAMREAVEQLACLPDFLLIDALTLPQLATAQKGIIKGDRLCLSIACASIIAKVTRDRIMIQLDGHYPGFGLARHKGYATRQHFSCLHQQEPLPIHRYSFAPLREAARVK